MRKIRIMEHVSLDGVMQHEDGEAFAHGRWVTPFRTPAGLEAVMEAQGSNFDLLLGRRTYDAWSDFWPKAGNSPIANRLNAATKYVATHRPDSLQMGPGRGFRHGRHRRYSPRQVNERPRPDRLGQLDADISATGTGAG